LVNGEPLVISVPARELVLVPIAGSVFDTAVFSGAVISAELRLALDLVTATYRSVGGLQPVRCVARPEIFTHGLSLEWLKRNLGQATQHLCLSDGTSIKLIPRFRNHLFTYGLQSHQGYLDFKRLLLRAPELLMQCHSQVNSFHRVDHLGSAFEPSPNLMQPTVPLNAPAVWFFGFYLNPNSLEDSAEHMLNWGEIGEPQLLDFEKVTYIPLTEAAANDIYFQRVLAELISAVYFDPTHCLFIRLPLLGSGLTDRMRLSLDGIRRSHLHIPQVRSRNIFFASGDLPEEALAPLGSRLSFVLHHTFEFWRYTRPLYQEANEIAVFLDRQWKTPPESAKRLFLAGFGRAPKFILSIHAAEGEWAAG